MGTSESSLSLGFQAGAEVTAAEHSSIGIAPALPCWDAEPAWGWDGKGKEVLPEAFLYATALKKPQSYHLTLQV